MGVKRRPDRVDTARVTRVLADDARAVRRAPSAEAGSIVLAWLVKISVALVLVAVFAFDAISVAATHLRVPDDASLVASATRDALDSPGSTPARALAAGRKAAAEAGYRLGPGDLTISRGVVIVQLRATAPTVVLERVGPLRSWAMVTATSSARSSHLATPSR